MSQEEIKNQGLIRGLAEEFNLEIITSTSYESKRSTQKTPEIFYDDHRLAIPEFDASANGWCQIPNSLTQYLEQAKHLEPVILFDVNEEIKLVNNEFFISECRNEMPYLLKTLISSYLKLQFDLTSFYSSERAIRLKNKINEFYSKLLADPHSLIDIPKIISKISKDLKMSKSNTKMKSKLLSALQKRNDTIALMNSLRKVGKYSVKEICEECGFSPTTYYLYCKREDKKEWDSIRPRGGQYSINSLNEEEKKFIKLMVDDPKFCYTVPEIRDFLNERFHRSISRGKVYRYISKGLGYSFKLNSYSAPPAFEPVQNIIRYKIAKKLIESYQQDKTLLFLDETGIDLSVTRLRSFSRKSIKPYRMRISKSQRLNIIMVITKDNVFCYQVVKGSISELECISFILSCICHIIQSTNKSLDQYLLVMDNYGAHRSSLMMKFLRLSKIPTLFTPVYYCFLNPIEIFFSFLKRGIKNSTRNNMYFTNSK